MLRTTGSAAGSAARAKCARSGSGFKKAGGAFSKRGAAPLRLISSTLPALGGVTFSLRPTSCFAAAALPLLFNLLVGSPDAAVFAADLASFFETSACFRFLRPRRLFDSDATGSDTILNCAVSFSWPTRGTSWEDAALMRP